MYRGDLIGCTASFDEEQEGKIPIIFSLNGQVVAQISLKLGSDKPDIFPFVGMKHKGIRVLAKVCKIEFMLPNDIICRKKVHISLCSRLRTYIFDSYSTSARWI